MEMEIKMDNLEKLDTEILRVLLISANMYCLDVFDFGTNKEVAEKIQKILDERNGVEK